MSATMLYLEQVGLKVDQVNNMTKEAIKKHMSSGNKSMEK